VPINRQYKIAELMEACRQFPGLSWTHKITWEYVMLKGMSLFLRERRSHQGSS
jgi:23S rRNA (adenine2503-C2)-methyltransferase